MVLFDFKISLLSNSFVVFDPRFTTFQIQIIQKVCASFNIYQILVRVTYSYFEKKINVRLNRWFQKCFTLHIIIF